MGILLIVRYRKHLTEKRTLKNGRNGTTDPIYVRSGIKEHSKEVDDLYEYRKGTDKIRDAFRILEENHLNIFRDR